MASLIRPLSKVLSTAVRKPVNFAVVNTAVQQRFKSDKQQGSLDKPLEKAPLDKAADPRESCMTHSVKLTFTNLKCFIIFI
jgi:hypothetical protein